MGSLLSRGDYEAALRLMGDAGSGLAYDEAVSTLLTRLPRLVASELTTLSFCDLARGRRTVVSYPARALAPDEIDSFNRFFAEHPLVAYHRTHRGGATWRISDSLSGEAFRRTPLYNEYYRRVGIDHAAAILGISARTVQKHLENVFAKLGVETRTAAAARLKG